MSCNCFGDESSDPNTAAAVATVNGSIDSYTSALFYDLRNRVADQRSSKFDFSTLKFPAPYFSDKRTVSVNCGGRGQPYELLQSDEFYGDIGFFDDLCFYGKYSKGMLAYSFDESAPLPTSTQSWESLFGTSAAESLNEVRRFFSGTIGRGVYQVDDVTKLQNADSQVLEHKLLNVWEYVSVDGLSNSNQILSSMLQDFSGDDSDLWCTLIAFGGFGAHRTAPCKKNEHDAYFVSDVRFLSRYDVRHGFEKYGAAAYFDAQYQLKEIFVSATQERFKPTDRRSDWLHAKWAWKVSLSVAVLLVDQVCHSQFREAQSLVSAIRGHLSDTHPIRRMLLPFTIGTVYRNRATNEYLAENGLYHRCLAFKYVELQRLVRESMESAPPLQANQERGVNDRMKYRFRLMRKKVHVLSKLSQEIYPIYTDVWDFWTQTLDFVTKFVKLYYGQNDKDDSQLERDDELKTFYAALIESLSIDAKYRLKKFNIINVLTHFLCNATIWSHHLHSAVSFEYSMDADFTGLKIAVEPQKAKQNNVPNYVEYCSVVLSKGFQFANIQLDGNAWQRVLQNMPDEANALRIFKTYFEDHLNTLKENINDRNNSRIAPFNACNPKYLQASIAL